MLNSMIGQVVLSISESQCLRDLCGQAFSFSTWTAWPWRWRHYNLLKYWNFLLHDTV